jgi:hypothetical protein
MNATNPAGKHAPDATDVADAVHLDRIDLDYRQGKVSVPALRDVTIRIRAGRTLALLGPSGSGKSTALKCLAGFLRPTAGSAQWRGPATRLTVAVDALPDVLVEVDQPGNTTYRVGDRVGLHLTERAGVLVSESVSAQGRYGDPGSADAGTVDPGTADPGTADPGTSDPGTVDPGAEDLGALAPAAAGVPDHRTPAAATDATERAT